MPSLKFRVSIAVLILFSYGQTWAQEEVERRLGMEASSFASAWTYSFFSIASVTASQLDEGGAAVDSYNYVGGNYRLSSDTKLSVRVPFLFNTAGFNKFGDNVNQGGKISDVFFAYSMYDLGYIGPVDLSGAIKVYLPTSEYSQIQKTTTRLRLDLYAEMAVGRFSSLNYVVKPDIYIQSQKAFFDPTTAKYPDGAYRGNPIKATKQASLEHYIEFVGDVNKYISVKPAAGFEEDWYYGSGAENIEPRHVTFAKLQMAMEIRAKRGLMFTVGIQNKPRLEPNRNRRTGELLEEVALFRPKDNSVFVMTNAFLF